MTMDLKQLNEMLTFLVENYAFGFKYLDGYGQSKKVKLSRKHLEVMLNAIKEAVNELERILIATDYSQKVKLLRFMLEAYDNLTRALKLYYYSISQGDQIDGLIEELSDQEDDSKSKEEEDESEEL